jgi:hypothetical protein
MARALAAVLALAGCDRVLGLDDIAIGENASTVHGHYGLRRVLNNSSRLPYTYDDPPVGRAPPGAFVQLADGNASTLVWGGDDHFYFNRASTTQAYRLVFPGVDPVPTIEYQFAVDQLELLDRKWGRPGAQRTYPMPGTQLHYSVPVPGNLTAPLTLVDSTGIWTQSNLDATQTVDWTKVQVAPDAGPIALLDATPLVNNDRAYYLIYDRPSGATFTRLYYYRFDDVTLGNGEVTTITSSSPPFAINADSCVDVAAPRANELARITAAGYIGTSPDVGAAWSLLALPVLAMGPEIAFLIAYDGSSTDYPATATRFGTPFGGYDFVLQMGVVANHAMLAPGATIPVTVQFGSNHFIQPEANTACAVPTSFDQRVQLPSPPVLDNAPLGDVQLQLDRSRLAKLSWTPSQSGASSELYRADLYEVSAAGSATVLALRATWYTTNHTLDGNPLVLVDPQLLQSGKSYAIQVIDMLGYPLAGNGDLATIRYPFANGFAWTGVLQVTN